MTTPKRRGRKSLLSPQLQRRICELLAAGNTIKTVTDAVRISERVYFEWVERNPHFAHATTRCQIVSCHLRVAIQKAESADACALVGFRECPVSSPGEFPTQHNREDTFSGLIDLWAHGQRQSTLCR